MQPVVLLAGSRSLPSSFAPLISRVVSALSSAGRSLAVGCASGADALALASCRSLSLSASVFAVGTSAGAGFWSGSAPLSLLSAFPAVRWLAGGPLSLPLAARLSRRTRAAVAFAAAAPRPGSGAVVFFRSPSSRGSALAARSAVAAGLPVVAFPCCGLSPSALPSLGRGRWAPAGGSAPWRSAFRWVVA